MDVGAELARARRDLGLSVEEVSARTKIKIERLIAIEEMDTAQLPSLIYLKGFLRAYAAELKLDAEVITERYLAQLDVLGGLDRATPASRVAAATTEPVETDTASVQTAGAGQMPPELLQFAAEVSEPREPEPRMSEPRVSEPPVSDPPGSVPRVSVPPVSVPRAPVPRVTVPRVPEIRISEPQVAQPRYFSAYDDVPDMPEHHVPQPLEDRAPRRSHRRLVTMALVLPLAIVVGWLVGENYDTINAHYDRIDVKAIMERVAEVRELVPFDSAPNKEPDSAQGEPSDTDQPRESTKREPQAQSGTAGADRRPAPDDRRASDRAREAAATAGLPATAQITEPAPAPNAGPAQEPERRDTDRSTDAERVVDSTPVSTGNDLTGRWTLTNRIESSTYAPYNGMNVGFHLQLQQDGNRVTGTGEKWMENGRPLPPAARTPIRVEGTLEGDRLQLTFTERGARRTSSGMLMLDLTDAETLSGTFESDAANSLGTSLARRAQSPRR